MELPKALGGIFGWAIIFAFAATFSIALYSRFSGRGLRSPRKELHVLQFSLIILGLFVALAFFTIPHFTYYKRFESGSLTPAQIESQLVIQDRALSNLSVEFQRFNFVLTLICVFASFAIGSFIDWARAITPPSRPDHDFEKIFTD